MYYRLIKIFLKIKQLQIKNIWFRNKILKKSLKYYNYLKNKNEIYIKIWNITKTK